VTSAAYYDGSIRRFVLESDGSIRIQEHASASQSDESHPKILIISRQFYNEKVDHYPIESVTELKKLLALENQQDSSCFHAIVANSDNGSTVNSWRILNKVPISLITIPESVLLAFSVKNKQLLVQNIPQYLSLNSDESVLFALRDEDKIYSQMRSQQISNEQLFALSVGVAPTEVSAIQEANIFSDNLLQGLINLPITMLKSFFSIHRFGHRKQLIKNTLIPFFGVLIVYLMSTSGYLLYLNYELDKELVEKSSAVEQSLSQQKDYDERIIEYQHLKDFLQNKNAHDSFWLVLAEFADKAQLIQIRTHMGEYQIRGKADKATDILEQLIKHPNVLDASFESPTRIAKDGELFSIKLKLRYREVAKPIQESIKSKLVGNSE
tara:strand:- start:28359 stop:29501 length:1143 start_codon:yes stop_codon:yes gene_type:complete